MNANLLITSGAITHTSGKWFCISLYREKIISVDFMGETSLVVHWSEFLTTYHEVLGSIPMVTMVWVV
jgi:hypothetical protein